MIGILSCIAPFFGRTILVWLINAGSFGVILAYIFVPVAFLVLRKREPDLPRPYRVRFGKTTGILAFVLGLGLLVLFFPPSESALDAPEWAIILGWSVVGAAAYLYYRHKGAASD